MQSICYKIDSHNGHQEYNGIFKQAEQSLTKILRNISISWFQSLANKKCNSYCDCSQDKKGRFPSIDTHKRLSPLYYVYCSYQSSRQTHSKAAHHYTHT